MAWAVNRIAEKYALWVATARQKDCERMIWYLLGKHIPGCIMGEKVAFFDDSKREILDVQGVITSFLFDPNNIYADDIEVENRVTSWRHIERVLL